MTNHFPAGDYGHHLVEEVRAGRLSRRDLLRRASVVGLAMPATSLLLAACGSGTPTTGTDGAAAGAAPRRGGTLLAGVVTPTAAPDPVTMYDGGSVAVVQQVAEYLIWVRPDNTLEPVLATAWTPNADASAWTFTIRSGVTFSDGTPLTADDVVATFERLVNPASQSSALTNFHGVLAPGGVVRTGDLEVTFHLERPFVDFPYTVASTNYNTVILPKDYAGDFLAKPIGTGPFTLTSYATQASATFARNPRYWRSGQPYLDGVKLVFFSSGQAQLLAVQSGTVDVIAGLPPTGSELFSDPNLNVLTVPSTYYNELFLRTDQAPFTDKRVRQALAYSLQRDVIISNLYQGHAQVGNDEVWAPAFPDAPALPQRSYDPARARALLSAAGYGNGFTTTLTTEQTGVIPQYATLVQAAAKAIGVTVNLNVESQAAFYGSGSTQPWLNVPLGIVDWAARATPQQFFGSSYVGGSVWNSAHWHDDRFDILARQYESTVDEQSRRGVAAQLAAIQQDETPSIIAYWVNGGFVAAKKVGGLAANGSFFFHLSAVWTT